MALLFVFVYACAAISLAACIVRTVRYARLPLNLRWELYPVPHQDAPHAGHGGSYFEEPDWWTRPHPRNHAGELRAMASEILFLRAMYEHNRGLWYFSYPFHLGLYVLIATAAAAGLTAISSITLPFLSWLGLIGCILVIFGAAGLLASRIRQPKLRAYSAPADYFNLCFFLAAAALLASAKFDGAASLVEIARALMTFETAAPLSALQSAALAISTLLVAYIPLTHMSHFIGKYFTYHAIRWSDQPAESVAGIGRRIAEYLTYRPTWSAPHIGADGTKPWAEIAAHNPTEKSK